MRVLVLTRDKRVIDRTIDGLADMQAIVEGYIEPVRLSDGSTLWVNEEFRLGQFGPGDFNSVASDVAGLGGRPDLMLTGILGNTFLTGPTDPEGNGTDVTDTARRWVERVGNEAGATWTVES